MQVFEKGHFAGLEDMKRNERLFNKVAPMGVNDIMMAVQYRHTPQPPLDIPVTSFEGLLDETIEPANVLQWGNYTTGPYRNVPIMGDHYFVSTKYREVAEIVRKQLMDLLDAAPGGLLGNDYSWV